MDMFVMLPVPLIFPVFIEQAAQDLSAYLELASDGPYREEAAGFLDELNQLPLDALRPAFEELIGEQTRFIEQNPNDALAYRQRAISYAAIGENDRAVQDIKMLLEVSASSDNNLNLTQDQVDQYETLIDNNFDLFYFLFQAPDISY